MELLSAFAADMSGPRITTYDEVTGSRMDFSGQTLENWVAKIANFLREELDLTADTPILIDLPAGWQPCVIALGAIAAGVPWTLGSTPTEETAALFLSAENLPDAMEADYGTADLVAVTTDAFGRGVVETGGTLPPGVIDFGPTVRFYGDHFHAPTPSLADALADRGVPAPAGSAAGDGNSQPRRQLCPGWSDTNGFLTQVFQPLATGGSVVIVRGMCTPERLADIARSEKVMSAR